jgi:hypothetical protein
MVSEELQARKSHLWRLSETLCLNPAGGLSCHSASSFCSRLQAILLSACTRGKGSIELQPNREGKPTACRRIGRIGGKGVRYLSGRRGGARHGGGVLGEGNRIVEEDGRRRRRRRGREARRERNRSAVCHLPFFICGFSYFGPFVICF